MLFVLVVHLVGMCEYGHYTAQAQESVFDSEAINKEYFFILGRQRSGNEYVAMVI